MSDPEPLPARPRPRPALDRLPPPHPQDPGFRLPRGRPLPHAPDAQPRGGADRAHHRRASCASTRTWPRRWRWRTTSAIRRSGTPASARSTRAMRRLRRLRSQRPEPARRHAARAQVPRLRWAQPHLGDARGTGEAQWPSDARQGRRGRMQGHRPLEAWQSLEPTSWASAEAQVAALADDIAYLSHDIDDGLRAGLLSLRRPRCGSARRPRGASRARLPRRSATKAASPTR